jgi:hypothetical protein
MREYPMEDGPGLKVSVRRRLDLEPLLEEYAKLLEERSPGALLFFGSRLPRPPGAGWLLTKLEDPPA